eukprot:58456_1
MGSFLSELSYNSCCGSEEPEIEESNANLVSSHNSKTSRSIPKRTGYDSIESTEMFDDDAYTHETPFHDDSSHSEHTKNNTNHATLWDEIEQEQRELYRSDSSKLVLSENLFLNMKEETLVFFLRGSKKCLHLSRINSDEMQMSGFIVGGEIVNDGFIPQQIHEDIKRVYYAQNNREYVLSIVDVNGAGALSIFAYDLNSFECHILGKFPSFNELFEYDIDRMYFSLYYDDVMHQFHILCGPKTATATDHVWCLYDIVHHQNKVDYVALNVSERAPIIVVGSGQRFIFDGGLFMRYDGKCFVEMDVPHGYSQQTVAANYNILYVENEKRVYLFGGHSDASILTDIWYMEVDKTMYVWNEYKLVNIQLLQTCNNCNYKCIQSGLCFGHIVLIFAQRDTHEYIHYDTVYCLDLRQKKMVKADYKLVGFEKDIVVTPENIIHCITQKSRSHAKINALELIPDAILDFYRKRNTLLITGYLRQRNARVSLGNQKIIYHYLPII